MACRVYHTAARYSTYCCTANLVPIQHNSIPEVQQYHTWYHISHRWSVVIPCRILLSHIVFKYFRPRLLGERRSSSSSKVLAVLGHGTAYDSMMCGARDRSGNQYPYTSIRMRTSCSTSSGFRDKVLRANAFPRAIPIWHIARVHHTIS